MRKDAYLEELIQILENEKMLLKKAIKAHLAEGDYRVAHKYSKGLAQVSSRLSILYQFLDPAKRKIEILGIQKKKMTKEINKYKHDEFMTDLYLDRINNINQQMQALRARDIEPFQDTQHIDDALFDISEEVIDSFQLLFKDEKVDMKFQRCPGNILEWSIGPVRFLRKTQLIRKKDARALENLGFTLDADKKRYVYHYDLSTFKNALVIKTMLARVIYDVFTRWYPYEIPKVDLVRDGGRV